MSKGKRPNRQPIPTSGGARGPAPNLNGSKGQPDPLAGILTADRAQAPGNVESATSRARKVIIGTPAHYSQVHIAYAFAMDRTRDMARERGIDLSPLYIGGDAIVQKARNDLVMTAIAKEADDLIFIDADQDWQPEWVFQLLDWPVDCVGAPVRKKDPYTEEYNIFVGDALGFIRHPDGLPILTSPDLRIGTGFMRYSRRALLALWEGAEPYATHRGEARWIFDIRPVNGVLFGEDTVIADKLRAANIPTWLDPSMDPGHYGECRVQGAFAKFLGGRQQQIIEQRRNAPPPSTPHPAQPS